MRLRHFFNSNSLITMTTTLPEVVQNLINKSVRHLEISKCQFKVIAPDGTEYGGLEVVRPKEKKKWVRKVPPGFYKDIYAPVFASMSVGDVATFDPTALGVDSTGLYSAASGGAQHLWGNGAHVITTNKKNGHIEIMRTA